MSTISDNIYLGWASMINNTIRNIIQDNWHAYNEDMYGLSSSGTDDSGGGTTTVDSRDNQNSNPSHSTAVSRARISAATISSSIRHRARSRFKTSPTKSSTFATTRAANSLKLIKRQRRALSTGAEFPVTKLSTALRQARMSSSQATEILNFGVAQVTRLMLWSVVRVRIFS
ncbi:MAG: hypothetical protein IJ685_02905 [Selenomonadaceae bacterium]|nr:hypothetical protein [Selenomonadaceae bacterium]